MSWIDRRSLLRWGVGLSATGLGIPQRSSLLAQEAAQTPESPSELGDQLPPADLPTMNEQGFTFSLDSTFTASMDEAPTEAAVYKIVLPVPSREEFEEIAARLNIEGDIEDQGGGTLAIEGNGSLFVTTGLMQYVSAAEVPEGDLPQDDEAIAFGREWMRQTQLLPADVGDGTIGARIEAPPRIIVTYKPVNPSPLLSAYPAISVTMGPQGSIIEASFRWADISSGDIYQLRGAELAWSDVSERRSYLQTTLPAESFPDGSTIAGRAEFTTIGISYTSSGVPGEDQYLQPVYTFGGQLTPEGSKESFPITAYVPGLINSLQPVGMRSPHDRG